MKVAVVGANGQLGREFCHELAEAGYVVDACVHDDRAFDIRDIDSVARRFRASSPDLIINSAARVLVEQCEEDPDEALAVNAWGAGNVAKIAAEVGAYLIHISTDYVFDGVKKKPYVESDVPAPLNVYGHTKLAGEHAVQAVAPDALIMRTSGLYGNYICRSKGGPNFVELMLAQAATQDEVHVVTHRMLSPTSCKEVARQVIMADRHRPSGLCHATAEGDCSWYDFADTLFSMAGCSVELRPAAPGEFVEKVARPGYSVLENEALKLTGLNTFLDWKDGLREYLRERSPAGLPAAYAMA